MTSKKYPRALYRCFVNLRKNTEIVQRTCFTKNISYGGVCVVLDDALEINQPVLLEIDLKDSFPPVNCYATVRWSLACRSHTEPPQPPRFETGFQFVDISEPDLERIEKIVAKHAASSS